MPFLPPDPEFTTSGERDVWNALKPSIAGNDLLATNVRFTDHDGDHEGDLIVGLAGAVSKRIHPVDQARRTKYALRSVLDSQDRWNRRKVRLAHVVAFPYSTIPRGFPLPDCPRSMILDRQDLARARFGQLIDSHSIGHCRTVVIQGACCPAANRLSAAL